MTQSMLANNRAEISHSLVEMSDEWLVAAAKGGNVDAFAELGRVVEVDLVGLGDVDHAMIGGHEKAGTVR